MSLNDRYGVGRVRAVSRFADHACGCGLRCLSRGRTNDLSTTSNDRYRETTKRVMSTIREWSQCQRPVRAKLISICWEPSRVVVMLC